MRSLIWLVLPLIWVAMYLYRFVLNVIIVPVKKIAGCFSDLFHLDIPFLFCIGSILWIIILIPFIAVYEIVVGLFVSFFSAIEACRDISR
jgi:hypothetical protein